MWDLKSWRLERCRTTRRRHLTSNKYSTFWHQTLLLVVLYGTCRRTSPSSNCVAQTISPVDHCLIIFFFLVEQVSDSTSWMCCKAFAWHPKVTTQLGLTSKEDHLPVIHLWDLRQATAPINTFEGPQRGILAMDWCPEVDLFQHL